MAGVIAGIVIVAVVVMSVFRPFEKAKITFREEKLSPSRRRILVLKKGLMPVTEKYFIIGGNRISVPGEFSMFIEITPTADDRVSVFNIKGFRGKSFYIDITGNGPAEIKDVSGKRVALYLN